MGTIKTYMIASEEVWLRRRKKRREKEKKKKIAFKNIGE